MGIVRAYKNPQTGFDTRSGAAVGWLVSQRREP
jgi:hypothetical protein